MTEIKAHNGKLYLSAIFDCFDSGVLNLAMDTNMKAKLKGAIVHSDRGIQYTSYLYRSTRDKYDITQSMNSYGGRCHANARCESMWARKLKNSTMQK